MKITHDNVRLSCVTCIRRRHGSAIHRTGPQVDFRNRKNRYDHNLERWQCHAKCLNRPVASPLWTRVSEVPDGCHPAVKKSNSFRARLLGDPYVRPSIPLRIPDQSCHALAPKPRHRSRIRVCRALAGANSTLNKSDPIRAPRHPQQVGTFSVPASPRRDP
jgi:hypothetical protein